MRRTRREEKEEQGKQPAGGLPGIALGEGQFGALCVMGPKAARPMPAFLSLHHLCLPPHCFAEFPDEVEAPLDRPARQRFACYRGLKSLRSSTWDPKVSHGDPKESVFLRAVVEDCPPRTRLHPSMQLAAHVQSPIADSMLWSQRSLFRA